MSADHVIDEQKQRALAALPSPFSTPPALPAADPEITRLRARGDSLSAIATATQLTAAIAALGG